MTDTDRKSTYGISHVGVAVADLEKAVEFYKVFLQAEPISSFESDRKPFVDEMVGYEAKVREVLFPLGDGYLEVLQYTEPAPGKTDPETFNAGHMHCCVEVDDIEAEYTRLRNADIGIEFRSDGPVTVPESEPEYEGVRLLYLRTPDGSTFELYEPVR